MIVKMLNQKHYILLLTLFCFSSSISIEAVKSTEIDFSNFIPAPRADPLIPDSPQAQLREAYQKMRQKSSFKKLQKNANKFEEYILNFIDKDDLSDQTQFLAEVKSLRKNLNKVPPVLQSHFNECISILEYRGDLARIDQQIFMGKAVRGTLNHPDLCESAREGLNTLVGKIFHILQSEEGEETAIDIGSGILAHLDEDTSPLNIQRGDQLNGLVTCAHVLEAPKSRHMNGAYFISNASLDPETGLPIGVNNPVRLIRYLKDNSNSLKIDTYTLKRRIKKSVHLFPNNDPVLVNPSYWDNEDIVFAKFSQTKKLYQGDILLNFETIKNNKPLNFKENELYFAVGYPSCPHYDKRAFAASKNYLLVKELGITPLFVTSSLSHHQDKTRKQKLSKKRRPKFNKGRIFHEAPTAQGMSGGPLIKIIREETGLKIQVFGCIMSGYKEKEEGCY